MGVSTQSILEMREIKKSMNKWWDSIKVRNIWDEVIHYNGIMTSDYCDIRKRLADVEKLSIDYICYQICLLLW